MDTAWRNFIKYLSYLYVWKQSTQFHLLNMTVLLNAQQRFSNTVLNIRLEKCLKSSTVEFIITSFFLFCIESDQVAPMTHYCSVTYLINILKVKPCVEWSDGQVQVWQLELCYPGTNVSLVSINAKSGKTQAVFLQRAQVNGDRVVLIKIHGECISLDLWDAKNRWNLGI